MTGGAPAALAIVGPTASGKTALALALADEVPDLEIVSADAMQVYREMDIGTAKPTAAERARVPHHLIDVADPSTSYNLARYLADARRALDDIASRGARAILVGGTGLYVQALVDDLEPPGTWPEVRAALEREAEEHGSEALHARLGDLDPVAASRMEPSNGRRVVRALEVVLGSGRPFSSFGPGIASFPTTSTVVIGLDPALPVLDARIEARVLDMLAAGLVEEVHALRDRPEGLSVTARQALGYKEVLEHLEGARSLGDTVDLVVQRTRRFARRQRRWFRRDPRTTWAPVGDVDGLVRTVRATMTRGEDGRGLT